MTNNIKYGFMMLLFLFSGFMPQAALAERVTKDNVTIDYTPLADGNVKVNFVANKSAGKILVEIDGKEVATILANSSAQINRVAGRIVKYNSAKSSGAVFWRYKAPASTVPKETNEPEPTPLPEAKDPPKISPVDSRIQKNTPSESRNERSSAPVAQDNSGGYPAALDRLNQDPFFSPEAVAAYVRTAESLEKALEKSQNQTQFVIDNDVEKFIMDSDAEMKLKKSEIPIIAQKIVIESNITNPTSQSTIVSSIVEILNTRLNQRETAYIKLRDKVNNVTTTSDESSHSLSESIINYSVMGVIIVILLVWLFIAIRKKKKKGNSQKPTVTIQPVQQEDQSGQSIVVRRRTTSILKKQSIDDIVGNPEYLLINSAEFSADSAVRNIYIKNSCIKDVYNLYAEDLRNSDNPKEDGCMVLGRWILDEETVTAH